MCGHAARRVARTKPHRYLVLLQTTHECPTPVPTTVTSSRKHADIMLRAFAPPNHPPGRAHTAGDRATSREMCRLLQIFCLHNQPSEVDCVRQKKTGKNAVRLQIPRSQHTTGVPPCTPGCTPAVLGGRAPAVVTPAGRCTRWGCPMLPPWT